MAGHALTSNDIDRLAKRISGRIGLRMVDQSRFGGPEILPKKDKVLHQRPTMTVQA